MALIGDTLAKGIFDSMAAQVKILVVAYGRLGTDSGTIASGANSQIGKSSAEFDTNVELARDFASIVLSYAISAKMTPQPAATLIDTLRAFEKHVQNEGSYADINDYLSSSAGAHTAYKVHAYLREIWPEILPANVWPLSIDTTTGTVDDGNEHPTLYTFESDGAGGADTGTAVGTDVPAASYGDCLLKGWVVTGKSVTTGASMTIGGTDQNGNGVSLDFTTTAITGPNPFAITGTTRFMTVTSVTETGTTLSAGDMFELIPKDDRAPTLVIP